MDDLRKVIGARRAVIEEKIRDLRAERQRVEVNLRELELQLEEIRRIEGVMSATTGITFRSTSTPTIKQGVMRVLEDYPNGLSALDILSKINERFAWTVPRTSLSPQLSRLKREGKIELRGSIWLPIKP